MQVLLAVTDKIKNLSLRGMWTSGLFNYLANRQGQRGMRYIFPELRSVLIQGVPSPCRACWRDYAHGDRRLDCRFLLQTAPKLHTLELYGMGVFDVFMDERATNFATSAIAHAPPKHSVLQLGFSWRRGSRALFEATH